MPVSRMRMRPWLEGKIDSNSISGLVWVDKEKRMFSIPWKHAARHGWQMDKDACLFKQWAIHTGKFKQGETNPDPKTWKANFRCAMNSLPDIEEVKDKSVNKGCGAVRVYRMLHAVTKKKEKKPKSKDGKKKKGPVTKVKMEDMDSNDDDSLLNHNIFSHIQDAATQENTVDSTENIELPNSTFDNPMDIPEWSASVEIGPDSTNDIYASLNIQVSPMHTQEYLEETEAINMITKQLESDPPEWQQSSVHDKGFMSNEGGPTGFYHSPESQWSESSAEELELRFYTELCPGSPLNNGLLNLDHWHSSTNYQIPFSTEHFQIPT